MICHKQTKQLLDDIQYSPSQWQGWKALAIVTVAFIIIG